MSEKQEKKASLPPPDEAYNNIFDGVHAQVFFGRLAGAGVEPQTEKEAMDLLGLSGRLRHAEMNKQAGDSRFAGALNALDRVLGNQVVKQAEAEEQEIAIKEAADEFAANPVIYNSVLSLKAYEAAQAAEQ